MKVTRKGESEIRVTKNDASCLLVASWLDDKELFGVMVVIWFGYKFCFRPSYWLVGNVALFGECL